MAWNTMPTGFIHGIISVYVLYCLIWDIAVDIATVGWMAEGLVFEFLKAQDFSHLDFYQVSSAARQTSYPMGKDGYFSRDKAVSHPTCSGVKNA
jgi:hypothetical protein